MKKSQSFDKFRTRRIGIDARFFGPRDKGFGRYTENLVRNLEKIYKYNSNDTNEYAYAANKRLEFFVFLRKERWDDYKPANSNFKKVLADFRWYGWKEQVFLPLKFKKYKLDLVHFTHFNAPIFYRGKFIVTIHDLTLRKFPTPKKSFRNLLFYPFKKIMYKLVFGRAVKKAEKIIAISNYTKQDILKYCKISPEKIEVIYEGTPQQISNFKFQISNAPKRKYLLYVGNAYPHKNLERLILAFKKIKKDFPNLQLVLAGGDDYFYKKLKIGDRIIFPGFISDRDLDTVYRNAALYVFPSLSEGFGLPSLEAMARGVPVVSSNATCLPEILGDAAAYFNPLDIDDMAKVIKKALSDENWRKTLIQKGFEQIEKYSWQKMAKETLKIYSK